MPLCTVCHTRKTSNADGLCPECAYKRAVDIRQKIVLDNALRSFDKVLENLPHATVSLADQKVPKRALSDMPDYSFTNVTVRSDINKLGNFVVVDVETTGLNKRQCEIIEVSAIRFENFIPAACFTSLIKPKRDIPDNATEINHITNDMVANSPSFSQIIPCLNDFIGSSNVVGHNLAFDLEFLFVNGLDLFSAKRKFYDTLSLAKRTLSAPKYREYGNYDREYDVESYRLDSLCDYYGIRRTNSHRSASDCLATGILFSWLITSKIGEHVGYRVPQLPVDLPELPQKPAHSKVIDKTANTIGNIFLALAIPCLIMLFSGKLLLIILGFLGVAFFGISGVVFKMLAR